MVMVVVVLFYRVLFQGCVGISGALLPVVRGTVMVAAAAAAGGVSGSCAGGDNSHLLQRSKSMTSHYRRSASPGGPSRLPSGASVDHDPGRPCRRLTVMVPPPPVITYSGASVCCTPTDDQSPSTTHVVGANHGSPTWTRGSLDSPSDAMLGAESGGCGAGYMLQASSPNRSVTVTPVGSFLAINQPPAEFGESMININGSSDCTSAGKPITRIPVYLVKPYLLPVLRRCY